MMNDYTHLLSFFVVISRSNQTHIIFYDSSVQEPHVMADRLSTAVVPNVKPLLSITRSSMLDKAHIMGNGFL
jgi:hypothetical protein